MVSQQYDEIDSQVARVTNLEQYVYPFENVVFEGGGNKGLAYCGAVRVSCFWFAWDAFYKETNDNSHRK